MIYKENKNIKICMSNNYKFWFNKNTGEFYRCGKTINDDPDTAPGPEILDIEISTICHQECTFCYKSNTHVGKNMSLEKFKEIFNKFDTKQLTQIAFGIGSIDGNPDLYKILHYTRNNGIIPNITINGYRMKDSDYIELANVCGAVAVSHYSDDVCFDAIKNLTDAGLEQVNIHQLLCEETFYECIKLIDNIKTDERLKKLNAVVFLLLKPIGDRNKFTQIKSIERYKELIDYLFETEIKFGFDSCSANNFLEVLKYYPDKYDELSKCCEPCESSLFSFYINVDGIAYPCSFSEHKVKGVDLNEVKGFNEVWNNIHTKEFRNNLLDNNRSCYIYNLEMY